MKRITLLIITIIPYLSSLAKMPLIDGIISPNEYGAKIAVGDNKPCPFNIANCKEMYFAQDSNYYYLATTFNATVSMNWAFIISLNDRNGGSYDPRPRMVTFGHPKTPSLLISGSFLSAIPHLYSAYINPGTFWTGPISFFGSLMYNNITVANTEGCLEISIPKSYLGTVTRFDVQFYLSGAISTTNTVFDALPDDNIPTSTTATTILHNYAHAFTALPIQLTDFNATLNNGFVDLKWQYIKPSNFSHFEIVRNDIVIGLTTGTYFKDITPLNENIYKLKMIDNDGSFTYSKSVSIRKQPESQSVFLKENPVRNEIKLSFTGEKKDYNILLYSLDGKLIFNSIYKYSGQPSITSVMLPFIISGNYRLLVGNINFNILIKLRQ